MSIPLMSGLALLLLLSGTLARIGTVGSVTPEPYAGASIIRFANGTAIDTRITSLPEPGSRIEAGTCWLVHLNGPVRQEWLAQLRRLGANPLCYLAYQTVVCRLWRDASAGEFKNLAFVDWLGPLPAKAKLALELISAPGSSPLAPRPLLVLSVWPDVDPNAVAARITAMGGAVDKVMNRSVRFRLDAALVPELAALESVAWIQEHLPSCSYNHDVQWVMQIGWRPQQPDELAGRPIWAHGIRGQNMIVGLFDTGINTLHDMFIDPDQPVTAPGIYPGNRKIVAYKLYDGAVFGDAGNFHGTQVACTLCGNDSIVGNESDLDGVAPDCRIYFVDEGEAHGLDVFDDDFTALLDSVRLSNGIEQPVRQVSGSFGTVESLSYYRLEESSVDAVCWKDKQFLVIWAAGNTQGPAPDYSIGHPSGAKNALTVGACGNGTQSNTIWSKSARGPCQDGRVKPDLLAPGESVATADGHNVHSYVTVNGTSISAPAVSGALMLLRQYFAEGWYPTGTPDSAHRITQLSSALMRAMAIAAADSNVGADYMPNNSAGWGRPDLSNIMHFSDDSNGLAFDDESVGVATDSDMSFGFDISGRAPLHVVLAWTDTAAAPEAAIAIVNDLNLELTSPDGNHYRGNQFYEGWSAPNPSNWDSLNVEEVCLVSHPLTGHWTARVIGHSIFTATQPFAVAVRGNIAGMVPGITENPNPELRHSYFVIRTSSFGLPLRPGWHLTVFTIDGRKVFGGTVPERGLSPKLVLAPGVYFYRLTSGSNPPVTGKLIIAR